MLLPRRVQRCRGTSIVCATPMSFRRCLLPLPLPVCAVLASPAASGAPIILNFAGGGNPDENVLFQGAGVVHGPAAQVTGRTNQTSTLFDVTNLGGSNPNLIGQGG